MGVLRFLLAISVIIAHTSPIFGSNYVGGIIAVKSFYIISGFYMSLILNEKYLLKNNSYKLFITNRFLKIYPMYWLVFLLTMCLYIVLYFQNPNAEDNLTNRFIHYASLKEINFLPYIFLVFVNLFIVGQDSLLFMGLSTNGGFYFSQDFRDTNPQLYNFLAIPQAWTISLELVFYLLAPFIVRKKLSLIIPLVILSFIIKMFFFNAGLKGDPWNYRFFPFEIGFFLAGNICYRLYEKIRSYNLHVDRLYWPITFVLVVTSYFYGKISLHIFIREYLYYLLIFTCIPLLFISSKGKKLDTFLGELSYPLYISHMFVLLILTKLDIPLYEQSGLITLLFTVLFSVVCQKLILNKIEAYRQNRVRQKLLGIN